LTLTRDRDLQPVCYPLRQLTLRGWRLGSASGPLCLCLHGWLDNANSFLPLARELPELHFIAIDLPGHGRSDHRSADAHYHFFDWVDDVVQLLQSMQLSQADQPVTLIGHSMGGMIATAVAASFPELVQQLILIDSMGFVTGAEADTSAQLRKAVLSRRKRLEPRKPLYPDLPAAAAARQAQSDFDLDSAMLLAERGTVQQAQQYTWSADMRLREVSAYRLSELQAVHLIKALRLPTLAIMASAGSGLMQQARWLWQGHYPQLDIQEVAGGHHLHMTHSIEVAAQIRRFLAT